MKVKINHTKIEAKAKSLMGVLRRESGSNGLEIFTQYVPFRGHVVRVFKHGKELLGSGFILEDL